MIRMLTKRERMERVLISYSASGQPVLTLVIEKNRVYKPGKT